MLQVGQSRAQLGDSFRLQSHEGAWNPTDHAFRPPTLLLAINLTTVDFRVPLLPETASLGTAWCWSRRPLSGAGLGPWPQQLCSRGGSRVPVPGDSEHCTLRLLSDEKSKSPMPGWPGVARKPNACFVEVAARLGHG